LGEQVVIDVGELIRELIRLNKVITDKSDQLSHIYDNLHVRPKTAANDN